MRDFILALLVLSAWTGFFVFLVWMFKVVHAGAGESAEVEPCSSWGGERLVIAAEYAGEGYNRKEFSYPPSVEGAAARIYDLRGMYSNRRFQSIGETQIEHLVPLKEAWRSGAWAWDGACKRAYARDGLNIVLASPEVNRVKSDKDPKDWLPERNRCFFALQWTAVKLKWGLTADAGEWAVLDSVLSMCGDWD